MIRHKNDWRILSNKRVPYYTWILRIWNFSTALISNANYEPIAEIKDRRVVINYENSDNHDM